MSKRRAKSKVLNARSAPALAPDPTAFNEPSLYVNRELSLLAFQRRVLEEAGDATNPLLERVKFLSILGSNLEEFFMVRVADILDQTDDRTLDLGEDGISPWAQFLPIHREVKKQHSETYKWIRNHI